MHSKLDIIIRGIKKPAELEIVKENLAAQSGVKIIKAVPYWGYAEIKLEFDANIVTKQQIFDVIEIGGYFTIEERGEEKINAGETVKKISKAADRAEYNMPNQPRTSEMPIFTGSPRMTFICGLMSGLLAISLIMNVYFGYILFKFKNAGGGFFQNSNNIAGINNNNENPADTNPIITTAPQNNGTGNAVQGYTVTKSDHVRGDINAPVTLLEYSDFQCPFCARHIPTLNKILAEYKGKVKLVYKHFPLPFHNNAAKASEASECAGEQDKFWEYHDKLFENQSSFGIDNFKKWAKDLKLNTTQFNSCLDSGKYTAKVKADENDGKNRGVQGTPATFVNGKLVSGAVPFESFKPVIDEALKNN